ncbi:hypothetical protein CcaverHIS002_0311930 [Cutaneotrichosporon cavernicola]|nr:hypothetical protein CcaverHIS002_0311930 [Cutaneotrichosporon cavernicola]
MIAPLAIAALAIAPPSHCCSSSRMYTYAGTKNGDQCYCARQLASFDSSDQCTTPCPAAADEFCGGPAAIMLYRPDAAASAGGSGAVGAVPTSVASSVASASTSAPPAPTATNSNIVTTQAPVPSSSATKYVWAHHMVGNTEFYKADNWTADVTLAKNSGIDGFALNMGATAYQPQNVEWAYTAAQQVGGFKMFFSFDMTSFPCMNASDVTTIAQLAAKYVSHPAQAMYGGKALVSTFSGETCTFGQASVSAGWDAVRKAIGSEIYFMPATFMTTAQVTDGTWYDGQIHWDAAWPQGADPLTTRNDTDWISALGTKGYMPPVSPFFFTYYGKDSWDKNWIYRSDDWLLATRFEQVIGMRDKVDMLELLSWNDFGESHYLCPLPDAASQPNSTWTTNMPHTPLLSLVKHYSTIFKTGTPPTDEGLWLWTRPHPKDAVPSNPTLAKPARAEDTDDNLYVVAFLTQPANVRIWSGTSETSGQVEAGLMKLKVASATGVFGAEVTRDNKTVLSYSSEGQLEYTDKPVDYNFNYFVAEGAKGNQKDSRAGRIDVGLSVVVGAMVVAMLF